MRDTIYIGEPLKPSCHNPTGCACQQHSGCVDSNCYYYHY